MGVAGSEDLIDVILRPRREGDDDGHQAAAEVGEFVVDPHRHLSRHGADDEAIALQGAQGLGEPFLAGT